MNAATLSAVLRYEENPKAMQQLNLSNPLFPHWTATAGPGHAF
jgi:hypothetical protein